MRKGADSDEVRIVWLEAFVLVAEGMTQTAAAALLGRSQSQVGRDVRALADWLRTPLFDGPMPARLSPFGEQFLETARQVLALLQNSRQVPPAVPSQPAPRLSGKDIVVP